jgi:ADP-heptose:LPS heptosyltransferase
MVNVIRGLEKKGWEVILLGHPQQLAVKSEKRIINCATDKLTFRQSCAVLATADVFLGPDSALIHVAGALGVPAVGLFSVVPWNLRTSYCPTTFVIQGKTGCDIAPCFFASRTSGGFPAKGPCAKTGRCEALWNITPEQVMAKVEQSVRE